jgi:acetylglutamate kinase
MLARLGIKSRFAGGLRVTASETMEIVEMVLAGSINKQIVSSINKVGGKSVGISGKDANLLIARKLDDGERIRLDEDGEEVDLGYAGVPHHVDPHIINTILNSEIIPVIAPVGVSKDGESYNVNADTFAAAIAGALRARRLLLLTDVEGVLDENGELIDVMTRAQARRLIADGVISGGMIPKIESCMRVLDMGVEGVVVINGKEPHAVLLELLTRHGAGTLMVERMPSKDGKG